MGRVRAYGNRGGEGEDALVERVRSVHTPCC